MSLARVPPRTFVKEELRQTKRRGTREQEESEKECRMCVLDTCLYVRVGNVFARDRENPEMLNGCAIWVRT